MMPPDLKTAISDYLSQSPEPGDSGPETSHRTLLRSHLMAALAHHDLLAGLEAAKPGPGPAPMRVAETPRNRWDPDCGPIANGYSDPWFAARVLAALKDQYRGKGTSVATRALHQDLFPAMESNSWTKMIDVLNYLSELPVPVLVVGYYYGQNDSIRLTDEQAKDHLAGRKVRSPLTGNVIKRERIYKIYELCDDFFGKV